MTCVVGYRTDAGIWIGADSAGTTEYGSQTLRADSKVFACHGFTMGFCGSFRMGQVLRFNLTPSAHSEGLDDYEYMVTTFVEDVRKVLKRAGYSHIKNNVETGGNFLVAYRDALYEVEDDFQVGITTRSYACIGSGEEIASGAMSILDEHEMAPDKIIKRALKAAADHDAYVAAPFKVIKHKADGVS